MEWIAARSTARRILGHISPPAQKLLTLTLVCLAIALAVAFLPQHEGLPPSGRRALFILVWCSGLWVTEAMPAFAVSLLAMASAIALLGRTEQGAADWEKYIGTWGSPLIWLFFGGFILAAAASKTRLDVWMAGRALHRLGKRPAVVLMGVMAATAVLSMFLSNTATATMMVAMLMPLFGNKGATNTRAKAMLLGVAMAANIGGMGTIIGTPPNAIAAGAISNVNDVSFAEWMVYGVPPAMLLMTIAWGYITVRYLGRAGFAKTDEMPMPSAESPSSVPVAQQALVIATFSVTVFMWLTSPWHGIPTTVTSFVPICVLTATSTLDADDVKGIPWDVLLLIAGGLSLGVAVSDSGLANWLVSRLPVDNVGPFAIAFMMALGATVLSNLMSNTAAANVIVPIALALLGTGNSTYVIPIALAASTAMCLAVSTPPNAIVYGTRRLKSTDLLYAGLLMGLIAPFVVVGWTAVVVHTGWLEGPVP